MHRATFLFLLVGALLTAGAARLAWLEKEHGEEFRRRAVRQQSATLPIPAQRGDILDARGRVLAGSIRRPSVFVDPTLVQDVRFAAHSLGPVLGVSAAELERLILERSERGFVWVKRRLSDEGLAAFENVRGTRRLQGFGVQYEPVRSYPFGSLAAPIIGFVGAEPNQPGLAGIEQSFDSVLRGQDGRRAVTVDVRRRRLRSRPEETVAPREGANVVLTIDAYIQQITETHLKAAVNRFGAEWGTAVVMDPQTGEVLAMASVPAFDPAKPIPEGLHEKEQIQARERLRNRAIADAFEPGSIFKPFIAAPALEARLTRLEEVFAIRGPARQFGSRTIRDVRPYDSLLLKEVISKSSNIGMGLLGARVGNRLLYEWVRRFGFGDSTGIRLPGEHDGQVNDFSRWGPFSTQSIPIGQEISVTPLQLVAAFCALCNDGILYRPRIVRGVVSASGEVLEDDSRPVPIRRVLDARVAHDFRIQALAETVRSGTGRAARIPGYQVFGKTGTAQIARPGAGYVPGAYVGSFLGGAPCGEPRAAVIVSLYRPSREAYYGGTVAAPTVARILGDTLYYLRVPPELGPEDDGSGSPAGRSRRGRPGQETDPADAAE